MIQKGDEIVVDVDELSSEGKGVSRVEGGYVVFSSGSLPGDKARVIIRKKKQSYAESTVSEIISPSPYRVDPRCGHFGKCGGCKIQDLDYNRQILFKTSVVENALKRIGGFEIENIPTAIPSPETFFYRNKMEFSFSDDLWRDDPTPKFEPALALGLHVPGFHSKIIGVSECFLQSELSNSILNHTREFFKERNIKPYTTRTHTGYLRFLVIRQTKRTSQCMVNLITSSHDEALISEYKNYLLNSVEGIDTIVNSITSRKAQIAYAEESYTVHGSGVITETLLTPEGKELSFQISPNSFFQTNILQCEKLFASVVEFAELNSGDKVLDLYCGTGAISFFLSEKAESILGVEIVEDSIKDAGRNAAVNGIVNCTFLASDIKEFLSDSKDVSGFSTVVLDPPRSGLHPDICAQLSVSGFRKIVYVSCNPHTQARDLQMICSKGKYAIERVQPFDMFPHTLHVENIVSLRQV